MSDLPVLGHRSSDACAGTAAADLEQGQGAGDRGVEALHLAAHGDADQQVAGLADQPVQARALAADHHADRLVGLVQVVQAGRRAGQPVRPGPDRRAGLRGGRRRGRGPAPAGPRDLRPAGPHPHGRPGGEPQRLGRRRPGPVRGPPPPCPRTRLSYDGPAPAGPTSGWRGAIWQRRRLVIARFRVRVPAPAPPHSALGRRYSLLSGVTGILAGMATATNPVFVGRSEELGRLLRVLARAEKGWPAVALVAGDAGVGKTRLLAELAGHAERQGARVLLGGCMEAGDLGLPYVPFVDAFRDLGARPGESDLVGPLAAAVPGLGLLMPRTGNGRVAAVPPGDGFERVQLFDGVLSLLVGLSELAPMLLVIEDLHWADRSTRDLVSFLTRTLRTGRVALVASYRSDDLHRRHPLRPLLAELLRVPDLERIELHPFSRGELAQHLAALGGGDLPAETVDRILARSEGNPFFAEELLAAGATRRDVALPEALADVLRDRIEALPDLAQQVLKVAAVAGRRVSHDLLVAAAGLPEAEVEQGLREAIAAQVLVTDPVTESYRFRHALLQEVVYSDLLPGERTRLHATYARLLVGDGDGGFGG